MTRTRGGLRGLAVIMVLLLASVAAALALAPLVQWGLRSAGVEPIFSKVVFRTLQISAMALTAMALMLYGAPGRASWGLETAPAACSRAWRAFAAGSCALAVVAVVLFLLDVRTTRYDLITIPGHWVRVVLSALFSAAVIASIEEIWFRGGLHSLLERSGGTAAAVWLSSILYALTHFVEPDAVAGASAEDWRMAARMLLASVHELFLAHNLGPLLALLAAGVWLAAMRVRHSDIIGAIALHMGFVVVIKVFKKLTYIEQGSPLRWIAGDYDDVVGWLAFVVLLVFAGLAWWRTGRASEVCR